jgi:hypothetical protein
MTITGSNTTHFNFQKIGSNDDAGYSTIGEVIDSIDTLLDASDRLIAAGQSPTTGYTIEWNGSDWVAGQLDTAGIADSAVTSAKIADGTIVNADVNASAAIDKTKISGTAITAGDTGTVTSTIIANDTILNADINSAAAISYSKLNLASSIVNADISSSAAIADSKLATISTAGKVANTATTATNANTASAIVARDASGNFSAGTITASLSGNASTVTTNANLTGDVTSVGNATSIASGVIVNADVNASAAISYSKLNLTGSILEADLAFAIATQAELDTVASNASTALSNHEADTTSIHGISNTANLVATTDTGTVTNAMLAGDRKSVV